MRNWSYGEDAQPDSLLGIMKLNIQSCRIAIKFTLLFVIRGGNDLSLQQVVRPIGRVPQENFVADDVADLVRLDFVIFYRQLVPKRKMTFLGHYCLFRNTSIRA